MKKDRDHDERRETLPHFPSNKEEENAWEFWAGHFVAKAMKTIQQPYSSRPVRSPSDAETKTIC
jgi:hypothetical protein